MPGLAVLSFDHLHELATAEKSRHHAARVMAAEFDEGLVATTLADVKGDHQVLNHAILFQPPQETSLLVL